MPKEPNQNFSSQASAEPGAEAGLGDLDALDSAEQPGAPIEGSTMELSRDEIEQLQAKAAKADENWDRLVRLTAEFDNYRKRAAREKQEAIKFANEGLIEKLIPVLDSFDMGLAAVNAADVPGIESVRTGVQMIYNQLKSVMADIGLEEIDASNQPFDPAWHEAVSQRETAEAREGTVVQQLRKGYKLRERLIRPATVIVAKCPAA